MSSGLEAPAPHMDLMSRLSVLRELDSFIDFARGWLQLRIVLALGSQGSMPAKDIAAILDERYKAVLDALRKLAAKGLVVKEADGGMDMYRLSDTGLAFYRKLVEVLGAGNIYRVPRVSREERRDILNDIITNIIRYTHLAEAILALGTAKNFSLTLSDIATAMKLSIERTKTYLDMFCDRKKSVRLFARLEKESKLLKTLAYLLKPLHIKIRTSVEVYRLTDEGLTVFYRLPYYAKYRKSIAAKVISRLFGSAHPRIVLKKLSLASIVAALVSGVATVINPISVLAALTASISLVASLLYLSYKAV